MSPTLHSAPVPLLRVSHLCKRYPVGRGSQLHAVDDVSFDIARGETVGLVGESGCGKSTLVKLLTRLLDPTSGSIRFDGSPIHEIKAADFARAKERGQIQKVFQDAHDSLNPRFTAAEAIADPLRRIRGLRGAALDARVQEVADAVALPRALLSRYPHQLSGGQKARVGIARALSVEPRLLQLDEPTAALDVSVQAVILRLLEELKQSHALTYLFVSHDLNVVRLLCDRVLVMYLGRIVESGPAEEVFLRPRHPYTAALCAALPSAERRKSSEPRAGLPGEPRSPIDPAPEACRFAGRCAHETVHCTRQLPELLPAGDLHLVACHYPLHGPRARSAAPAAVHSSAAPSAREGASP